MSTPNSRVGHLIGRINRWLESGSPEIAADYMLAPLNGDMDLLEECLNRWESEGRLVWRKPVNLAQPHLPVVRFGKYPAHETVWPAPITGEKGEPTIKVDMYGDGRFVGMYPMRQLGSVLRSTDRAQVIVDPQ